MAKLIVLVIAGMLLFLVACGGGTDVGEPRESATDLSVTSQSNFAAVDEAGVFRAPAAPSVAAAEGGVGRVAPGLAFQFREYHVAGAR